MDQSGIIPPHKLLEAYARGIFPMAESRDDEQVNWYSASLRGVIPLDSFRVSKRVMRIIRKNKFRASINRDFRSVVESCAERDITWINDTILKSYLNLYKGGFAHSVEIYEEDKLAGGLYGVTLGAAFFAESMFQRADEASKIALYYCHQRLTERGFMLWDTQFYTDHLGQFGCTRVSAHEYSRLLKKALKKNAQFD